MTVSLSYLFETVSWSQVQEALLRHYPQQAKDMPSFRRVFEKLTGMTPEPTRFWLVIQPLRPWPDPDCDPPYGEAPADVGCADGSHCELRKGEALYGIDVRSWAECLGMEVLEVARERYTAPEIVAHCLWEMTWHGFDELAGEAFIEKLTGRIQEGNFLTWEEFCKKMGWEQS